MENGGAISHGTRVTQGGQGECRPDPLPPRLGDSGDHIDLRHARIQEQIRRGYRLPVDNPNIVRIFTLIQGPTSGAIGA
jgi:hypothetical protein